MNTNDIARENLANLASDRKLDVAGGKIRRTSSRFCFGVEHGDYNGTELFGVGTDRFIWMAYKPNASGKVRLFSGNFPGDGVVSFEPGKVPAPKSPEIADSWARFPYGADHILQREGYRLSRGFDAVLWGNIPGGGMSRSASLSVNLVLTLLEVNGIDEPKGLKVVDLAQAVETDYIGSPCGKLDQIMIYCSKAGMGTHYDPAGGTVKHVPLGEGAIKFRLVGLDTGTDRPGLEKSTYRIRRAECDELAGLAGKEFGIRCLADVKDEGLFGKIREKFGGTRPELIERLDYIYHAQKRFYELLDAWKKGDVPTVGRIFREDGIGLRDAYRISGPELETMCDIVRAVPGVLGERMLGGGDKGASGAIVEAGSVDAVRKAVDHAYPRSRPDFADKYAVHPCAIVDGVTILKGL